MDLGVDIPQKKRLVCFCHVNQSKKKKAFASSSFDEWISTIQGKIPLWNSITQFEIKDEDEEWFDIDEESWNDLMPDDRIHVRAKENNLPGWQTIDSKSKIMKEYDYNSYTHSQVNNLYKSSEPESWKSDWENGIRTYGYIYLHFTFQRLVHEGKVLGLKDYNNPHFPFVLLWNTNLIANRGAISLYVCVMVRKDAETGYSVTPGTVESVPYTIMGFWKLTDLNKVVYKLKTNHLNPSILPAQSFSNLDLISEDDIKIPNYFHNCHENSKCFNNEVPFKIKEDHLLDNKGRFPEPYCSYQDNVLLGTVERATKIAVTYCRANYRDAIPQYFIDKNAQNGGKIQLVLPLCLDLDNDEREVHCGVVLDYDDIHNVYNVVTVLDIDMIVKNCRLIHRIDRDWLCAIHRKQSSSTSYYPGYEYTEEKSSLSSLSDKDTSPDKTSADKPIGWAVQPKSNSDAASKPIDLQNSSHAAVVGQQSGSQPQNNLLEQNNLVQNHVAPQSQVVPQTHVAPQTHMASHATPQTHIAHNHVAASQPTPKQPAPTLSQRRCIVAKYKNGDYIKRPVLRQSFEKYGQVTKMYTPEDHTYARVFFDTEKCIDQAMEDYRKGLFHGLELKEERDVQEKNVPRSSPEPYTGGKRRKYIRATNIEYYTRQEIKQFFEFYGKLRKLYIPDNNPTFANVDFRDESSLQYCFRDFQKELPLQSWEDVEVEIKDEVVNW